MSAEYARPEIIAEEPLSQQRRVNAAKHTLFAAIKDLTITEEPVAAGAQ